MPATKSSTSTWTASSEHGDRSHFSDLLGRQMRVEICGGIATGKTTLASVLEVQGLHPLLEDFRGNPFWELFFADRQLYAFETEMSFLLQHYHQVKSTRPRSVLCDFSFFLDRAFAKVSLRPSEYRVFETASDEVWAQLGLPDLLIGLECPPHIQLARIQRRGRVAETTIELDYLEDLNARIRHELDMAAEHVPVTWIDSAGNDFTGGGEALESFREEVQRRLVEARRAYRNQPG